MKTIEQELIDFVVNHAPEDLAEQMGSIDTELATLRAEVERLSKEVEAGRRLQPDKCPRCGKATKPNENGIYQCVDGQLCGEAVSAEPKSDCSPPQTFGDDDDGDKSAARAEPDRRENACPACGDEMTCSPGGPYDKDTYHCFSCRVKKTLTIDERIPACVYPGRIRRGRICPA